MKVMMLLILHELNEPPTFAFLTKAGPHLPTPSRQNLENLVKPNKMPRPLLLILLFYYYYYYYYYYKLVTRQTMTVG